MSPVWTAGVEWALPDHNGKQDGHNDGGEREIQARQTGGREGDTGETHQGEGRRYRRDRPGGEKEIQARETRETRSPCGLAFFVLSH
jgi:hypothetical protein